MRDVYTLKAIIWYQSQPTMHPLTCGSDSNHKPLTAYVNNKGEVIGLKCEDCDYVQKDVPEIVVTMYREYLAKGWLANHKNEIIADLKNMISDIEDEHYGANMFFTVVEERVKKWRQLKKSDETDLP